MTRRMTWLEISDDDRRYLIEYARQEYAEERYPLSPALWRKNRRNRLEELMVGGFVRVLAWGVGAR